MPKIMYMDENYSGSSYGNLEEYSEDLLYSPSSPPSIINRWDTPLHTGVLKNILDEYQLLECGIGGSTTIPGTQVINTSSIPESVSSAGDNILAINLIAEENANTHCAYLTVYNDELLVMCSTGVSIPVWYIKGIKVGNSNIIPNPTSPYTDTLSTLQINNTVFKLNGSGGSEIEPNPQEEPTDILTSIKIDDVVYEIEGGSPSGTVKDNREIVSQSDVAIADGTAITLNVTKKYNDPYVVAVNVLPKTRWGGLVIVDENYGVTYDSTNDTISFKTFTNSAQNYDIDWAILELQPTFGGGSGGGYSETSLYTATTRSMTMQLSDDIDNYDAIGIHAKWSNGSYGFYTQIPSSQFILNHYLCTGGEGRYQYVAKTGSDTLVLSPDQYTWDGASIITEIIGINFN